MFTVLAAVLCALAVAAVALGLAGLHVAWVAMPGFGGAVVLWVAAASGVARLARRLAVAA